jgi:transcriptional regulator with XRE-family HTH domain
MTKLDPEICREIKNARKAAKISQSELSKEVGCLQSALSMFEQGDGTKLNDEVVKRLAAKFGIDLTKKATVSAPNVPKVDIAALKFASQAPVNIPVRGFCPNSACPSNNAYQVDGRTFLKPDRSSADPVGGRFCAVCGEVLEKRCPNCGASVHDGAVCSLCGEPYIHI